MELLLSHDRASREYVLNRLDRNHIDALARKARDTLSHWPVVELAYMPGDATWYSIIIARGPALLGAPDGGSGDAWDDPPSYIDAGRDRYVIVHAQSGVAVWCSPDDEMEWACQNFNTTEASQLAIAELLKAVFSQSAENEEDAKFLRKFGPDTGN